MTEGAFSLVLIGGAFDGVAGMGVRLAAPPPVIRVARCWSQRRCGLELSDREHPHTWFWMEAEHDCPANCARYVLVETDREEWLARYVPEGVQLPS